MNKEQIFWDWFKRNEAKYFFLNQIDDEEEKERLLNELEEHLHLYCENLYFEIGGNPDQKQDLIITAQGNSDFFDAVELLVQQSPELKHWTIIAFKPIREDYTAQYGQLELHPETMYFIPLSNKNSSKLGLRVYIDNYDPEDRDDFLIGTYLVLDNLLGEKSSGLDIGYVEIENAPPISERDDLIELYKLPRYISWKKNKALS